MGPFTPFSYQKVKRKKFFKYNFDLDITLNLCHRPPSTPYISLLVAPMHVSFCPRDMSNFIVGWGCMFRTEERFTFFIEYLPLDHPLVILRFVQAMNDAFIMLWKLCSVWSNDAFVQKEGGSFVHAEDKSHSRLPSINAWNSLLNGYIGFHKRCECNHQ